MKERSIREPFENSLSSLIAKYNYRTDIEDKIKEKLEDKISEGDVSRIFSGNISPRLLSDMNLLLFSQAFYECGNGSKEFEIINPYNIFTDNEFNDALHVSLKSEVHKDSMTFHNVTRDEHKKFGYIYHITNATADQIATMSNNNITNYNYSAQREAIIKELFGQDVKIPKIFPEKTDEIAQSILNNEYYPVDTIVVNVLKTGAEKIDFVPSKENENIGDLTLYKVQGSTNDIIDGANRQQGIVKADIEAKEKNKTIDTHFKIDVINVTLKNSNDCIRQINKQTPISSERVKVLDTSKYTSIVKDVNIYDSADTNILYQRIGESLKEYNELDKFTTVPIFSEGLKDHFEDILNKTNPIMYREVMQYQIAFFNEFFGHLYDNIENKESIRKTKKETVLLDINMFYCYVYISKELFGLYKEDKQLWGEEIKRIIKGIDFDKSNSNWDDLRTTGKLTAKSKDRLLDYLNAQIKSVVSK